MRKKIKAGGKTAVGGVLNVTPDSFSDGGKYLSPGAALKRAVELAREGADFVDIGAESSRPGSAGVDEEEELRRLIPVLKAVKKKLDIPVSVDTRKPGVARICLENGADIINDISGFSSPAMISALAGSGAQVVVMHMKGDPGNMQENPFYEDVMAEIAGFFEERCLELKKAGIGDIILDPGIGFGKRVEDNLIILKNLFGFKKLGYPVMVGTSRKSFIGKLTGVPVGGRLPGTVASCVLAVAAGADIVRVHDVKELKQALAVAEAILAS